MSPGPLLPGELEQPRRPSRAGRAAQVVEVARRIVEDEGAQSLTMRRLAKELGIQAPSLYKHFSGKADVELAVVEDAMFDMGGACHEAIHAPGPQSRVFCLLFTYRRHALHHPNLYRLATAGPLARDRLLGGLEEWAGNPFYVVSRDPSLARALWSFAHGMVILELERRYPPGSDLDSTWLAGARAFMSSIGDAVEFA